MIYKKKTMLIGILVLFVSSMILYNIIMMPKVFFVDEMAFIERVGSFFSFYQYQFYTLILTPLYLVFLSTNNIPFMQRIIRLKSKKRIALASMKNIIISSGVFIIIIFIVGIIYPLLFNVISLKFFYNYIIQCLLLFLLLNVIGIFVLIIETFTKNIAYKLGIPMIIIIVYHFFKMRVYNVFIGINFVVNNFSNAKDVTMEDLIFPASISVILLIGSIFIKFFVCSEEEYR